MFAHDHRFIPLNGQVFSESQFDSSLWNRYLKHFGQVTVTAREGFIAKDKSIEKLVVSSRDNVDFKFIPNLSSLKNQILKRNQAFQLMKQYVQDVDAIIARLPSEIGLLAIEAAISQGKPWAVEVVGCHWDALWNYGAWQGKLYAPIAIYRMRRAITKAPYALYVTDGFLQHRYPCRNGHTINCSNVEIPTPLQSVLDQRIARIQSDRAKIIFGLIGTLRGKYKGIQTVMAALGQIRSQLPPFEFRILGAGNTKSWENTAAKYNVFDVTYFDGTLPGGEPVFHWLDNIDIYLQPSLQEGLPRALIEAMSRGCPAIASNVAGIPELLDDKNLINPGDANQLGKILQWVADNKDWRLQEAQRNWQRAGDYAQNILEERRDKFWQSFAEYAKDFS